MDDFTKVTKSSGHTFHLAAVIIDKKITLGEHAELRIKVESTSFAVALFDAEPGGARPVSPWTQTESKSSTVTVPNSQERTAHSIRH
jgi:hypothetical protein